MSMQREKAKVRFVVGQGNRIEEVSEDIELEFGSIWSCGWLFIERAVPRVGSCRSISWELCWRPTE